MTDCGFEEARAVAQESEIGLHCADRRVVNAVGLMYPKLLEPGHISDVAEAVGYDRARADAAVQEAPAYLSWRLLAQDPTEICPLDDAEQ
nr:hypothetical protein [Burkholderia ambifaria]